jgi:hypothetical protein
VNARYPGSHQAIRRALAPQVAAGTVTCWRCGQLIRPGEPWDLGHDDHDRSIYRGPEHAGRCNRAAGARLGNQRQRARRERIKMVKTVALGVEISEDRAHTSIVGAGYVTQSIVLVDMLAYLTGTDATATVLRLRKTRTVQSVVIDPHSPGATLIKPLTDAEVTVTRPSTSDIAVAHGTFLDELAAGRLRHAGQPRLDAAVRHGVQRPLGGATAWQRRGMPVDVSPLSAATFAVWGLLYGPADYDLLESVW